MDIKTSKDKIITLYDRIEPRTVESAVKKIMEINADDSETIKSLNTGYGVKMERSSLPPITFMLSTVGGNCYDGFALYDVIKKSLTRIEVICSGKVMSMGIVILLASPVRKAYANTTFMIHQVSGLNMGTVQAMEESVDETKRLNESIFDIIQSSSRINRERLDEIKKMKKDWYFSAHEALEMGIITEII